MRVPRKSIARRPNAMPVAAIRFTFDEEKATQAAAYLLELSGGSMPYLRLLKLLYLAEREGLRRYGRPIVGDRYVAMKHGPVMSTVYDRIKGERGDLGLWAEHIGETGDYGCRIAEDPGCGALAPAEIEILKEVFELFRTHDLWHLRDYTHTLSEWRDPGETSITITPEAILKALGKTEEEIDEIRQQAIEREHFHGLFGS